MRIERALATAIFLASACRRAATTDHGVLRPEPTLSSDGPALSDEPPPSIDVAAPAPAPAPTSVFPFGSPSAVARYTCPSVVAGGPFRAFLAFADTRVSFVDGDDLLALVNRSPTGALPPTYAPADLVDLRDATPRSAGECDAGHACLRLEAATALRHMLDDMRAEGLRGIVTSAFRGFGTQCWVFASWARQARGGFCEATAQSALPGHSQHQLGTTVDLFTSDWAERGAKSGQGVFRNGFGCTQGGKWLDESGWRYGFVVPYPIDPEDRKDGSRCLPRSDRAVPIDPKTGYKEEPWHLRFIGVSAASRYREAWLASYPGSPREITLEQWIRSQRGLVGDAELPVCDRCGCGACATFADDRDVTPCGAASLRLDAAGHVVTPAEEPHLIDAAASGRRDGAVVVDATVSTPAHTPTQTPITGPDGPTYREGETFPFLAPYPDAQPHAYPDLPGAWRLAVETVPPGPVRWPWRTSMADPGLAATWNRANIVLPAKAGTTRVRLMVVVPPEARVVRATLLRDGQEHDTRDLPLP